MCGRYANHVKEMTGWVDILGNWPGEYALSMDIAPGQSIPVVIQDGDGPHTKNMRWGLVPAWSDTPRPRYATFNARIESVSSKPAFRGACGRKQSCLVPASGYYEWTGEKGHKIKHYIRFRDDSPLVMAGLWDVWRAGGEELYSCTILTRSAISRIAEIHPRMPLILSKRDARSWLEQAPGSQLESLQVYDDLELAVSAPPPSLGRFATFTA